MCITQSHAVPTILHQYELLSDMRDCELMTSNSMGVYELKVKHKSNNKVQNINKKLVEKKKHKIKITGDHHARGCAS